MKPSSSNYLQPVPVHRLQQLHIVVELELKVLFRDADRYDFTFPGGTRKAYSSRWLQLHMTIAAIHISSYCFYSQHSQRNGQLLWYGQYEYLQYSNTSLFFRCFPVPNVLFSSSTTPPPQIKLLFRLSDAVKCSSSMFINTSSCF